MTVAAQINSYEVVTDNDEQQLLQLVAQQPISVSIAVGDEFIKYTRGVYSGTCGYSHNHAVILLVMG